MSVALAACIPPTDPPAEESGGAGSTGEDATTLPGTSTSSTASSESDSTGRNETSTTGGSTFASSSSSTGEDAASTTVEVENQCGFGFGTMLGTVASGNLLEASGLAASRQFPGVLWSHNDSGDSARLFAMGTNGANLGTLEVPGASADDWEDIAIGPGPVPGVDYIYVADIGDNDSERSSVTVYRFPEPDPDEIDDDPLDSGDVVALDIRYAGGPRNAETLIVDSVLGDLYIVEKVDSGQSGVFRYPAPHDEDDIVTIQSVAVLEFGSGMLPGNSTLAVGGDASADGSRVVVRTYENAFVFSREDGEPMTQAFNAAACVMDLQVERQGESIAFSDDGAALFTVSEGRNETVWEYGTP